MAVRLFLRNVVQRQSILFKVNQAQVLTPLSSADCRHVPVSTERRFYSKIQKRTKRDPFAKLFDSGDLINRPQLPDNTVKFWYQDIKALDSAPDHIQKLATIQYASRLEVKEHEEMMLLERIEKVLGHNCHLEKRIALATLRVRSLKKHLTSFRRDKVSKSALSEKIGKRRKMLKNLRKVNKVNFQWIMKELNIVYMPLDKFKIRPLSRKGRRKKRAHKIAFDMKIEKVVKLREHYKEEKVKFDKYKAETLKEIEKDLKELNLSIDDVYNPNALSKKERVKKEKVQFKGRIWY
ncbi:28S ribosomal protein S15, mitochondrial-like [Argonauta hians]